jgi:hypothetical protein
MTGIHNIQRTLKIRHKKMSNTTKKGAKGLNIHLNKDDKQIVNRLMKI